MTNLNKAFEKGISDLDCDKKMDNFLNKILNYEMKLSENKNSTKSAVSEKYRELIESVAEEVTK